MMIYGRQEPVELMTADLLWRPFGGYIRFIWAITSRGPIILMCSDLTAKPERVLALYCQRIRIEVMFDTLKNRLGAFHFHFWTRYLPKHSRQPESNKLLKAPAPEHIDKVSACWQAMETFVFCASVAAGLLHCSPCGIKRACGSSRYSTYARAPETYLQKTRCARFLLRCWHGIYGHLAKTSCSRKFDKHWKARKSLMKRCLIKFIKTKGVQEVNPLPKSRQRS